MTDEPESANSLFSEPMKIFIPCPSRALSSRRAISSLSSSSSSSWRTRSRSAAARGVDQIGLAADDQHRPLRAVLAPDGEAARRSARARRRRAPPCRPRSRRRAAPAPRQGQAGQPRADVIADLGRAPTAVTPGGSSTTRFSTLPSAPTSTASAWRGDSGTKPSWRSTGSRFGTRTMPAQADRPDSAAVAAASASSIGPPRSSRRLDRRALLGARLGRLHHAVDEQPQPALGRHPPGRGVRMGEQAELLEILHDVADRGRRQVDARQPARWSATRPARRSRDSSRPPAGRPRARGRSAR